VNDPKETAFRATPEATFNAVVMLLSFPTLISICFSGAMIFRDSRVGFTDAWLMNEISGVTMIGTCTSAGTNQLLFAGIAGHYRLRRRRVLDRLSQLLPSQGSNLVERCIVFQESR